MSVSSRKILQVSSAGGIYPLSYIVALNCLNFKSTYRVHGKACSRPVVRSTQFLQLVVYPVSIAIKNIKYQNALGSIRTKFSIQSNISNCNEPSVFYQLEDSSAFWSSRLWLGFWFFLGTCTCIWIFNVQFYEVMIVIKIFCFICKLFGFTSPQRSIYGLYIKSAPFFGDLNFFPETKNNSRFYISKLFISLHDSRFSCPVTSLLNISLQSWCILFKIRKNGRILPNRCLLLLS